MSREDCYTFDGLRVAREIRGDLRPKEDEVADTTELPVRLTLEKQDKLRLKAEFDFAREHGMKSVGRFFLLVWVDCDVPRVRAGVICGRKFSLRAVDRNRARRLMWESFRMLKPRIKPGMMLLIPRRAVLVKKRQDVERELCKVLKSANYLIPSPDSVPVLPSSAD